MNPMFSKRIGVLVATALLAVAGCSNDSSSGKGGGVTGTIVGTVTSSTGSALAGVTVTPDPADGPAVVTNSTGKYSMPVAAGTYTLRFTGDNLQSATSASTDVAMGQTVTVDQVMAASPLVVTVSLPAAYKNGGPTGFNTTVSGITASVKMNGNDASADGVTWTIKDYYGLADPPSAATPSPASGGTTSFSVGDFETIRESANAWLNNKYGTTGTEEEFEYIQAPERDQLLSFGVQQVRAMSFKVIAKVSSGGLTSTGSAIVSPLTIGNGGNTQPLGMMVVANAPSTSTYAWTLKYLPTDAAAGATFGDPPAGVALQGADTKNPTLVPTVTGVYQIANGTDAPLSFRVSTYHGAGTSDADPGDDGVACNGCHSGTHALTQFAEWSKSPHANANFADPSAAPMSLFKLGLNGGEGTHYSESCISCHTVGYSKVGTAVNAGFDDKMADEAWTFPTPPATLDATLANWNALPLSLQHRGSIQCENCHGPLEPADHSSVAAIGYSLVAPTASMNAGVCLVCHDALNNHDKGPLWSASGHANTELAIEEGGSSKSCTRCHSAEGFMIYLPLQQAGTPGQLTDVQVATLAGVQLHSQTCQTCHDPHSTELRVDGDTKTLAGLFRVQNAGAGALCMVCHNSRSDAVKQDGYTFASSSLGRLGPHTAAQGDMFAGRNAFFMPNLASTDGPTNLPYLSAHAFLADTCVDCHVKWIPPDLKAQYTPAGTNHTFRSSTQICAECHADDIGERIQESVSDKMSTLQDKLSGIISAKLLQTAGFDTAAGARKDPANTSTTLPDPADLTVLPATVRSIVARQNASAVVVTLNDGSSFYVGFDKIYAANTTTSIFTLTDTGTQTFLKAYFNLLFVNNDGAKGIHNPAFAAKALDNAATAVSAVVLP